MITATKFSHENIVQYALENGAKVDAKTKVGYDAFCFLSKTIQNQPYNESDATNNGDIY